MKIKTKQQTEELGLKLNEYIDGDWEYVDNDGYFHLMRGREEIAKGKLVKSYINGNYDCKYKNKI